MSRDVFTVKLRLASLFSIASLLRLTATSAVRGRKAQKVTGVIVAISPDPFIILLCLNELSVQQEANNLTQSYC